MFDWIYRFRNVQSSSFSRSAAVAHALESWKLLTKTYSYLRSRPIELQNSVQLYLVNAVKLLDFLIQRGYNEVSTLMVEFLNGVLGTYLKKPRLMCESSQAWVQSREVLRLVCQTPSNSDTLSALLTAIDELKMRYLNTMTSSATERDDDFIAYAVDQISDLGNRVTQRLLQCHRKKKFGLLF
ncbi:hypothetical protein Y032_0005g2524 [Ancylostoma ceylanicum]|uniref:Uncharacterized protein n=1 Tax=Ancylostoma ceylanicum TaxID=53326 RepID=A0A016VTZ2_9BILA|nr:hypothetical protein Y032_0005g2524 [Ancylostoma ceylanicum]